MDSKQKMSAKKIAAPVQPMEVANFTTADGLTVEMKGVRVFVTPEQGSWDIVNVGGTQFMTGRVRKAFNPAASIMQGPVQLSPNEGQMLDDASKSLSAAHTNLNSANECIEAFLQQGR
ncbi:hypothetical protein [Alteromonas australica]|uniref:Uncharacterized protein n=1 Tax=Alteromonas australica TaxID=589873 RepID=A0A075NTQ3_9ALTE|nr:hypothetical protein [Alteromonas australica]AIF97989.1 hypothetical protein EP13_04355 [Alteromonas australica]